MLVIKAGFEALPKEIGKATGCRSACVINIRKYGKSDEMVNKAGTDRAIYNEPQDGFMYEYEF